MRKKVQQIGNQQRHRFRAKFCRLGYKVSYGHFGYVRIIGVNSK